MKAGHPHEPLQQPHLTIRVAVGSSNPCKIEAVRSAFEHVFGASGKKKVQIDITSFNVPSGKRNIYCLTSSLSIRFHFILPISHQYGVVIAVAHTIYIHAISLLFTIHKVYLISHMVMSKQERAQGTEHRLHTMLHVLVPTT